MAPFYGWGSTASRLEPLRGGSLLFTTKFPEIPGTYFIINACIINACQCSVSIPSENIIKPEKPFSCFSRRIKRVHCPS